MALKPVGTLNCRASISPTDEKGAPAAGLTCLLTFDDDSPPLQFQGELHHPGFQTNSSGDRIIVWRVHAEGGHMPVSSVAGEYEVKAEHAYKRENGRKDILIGGAKDAIMLEPSEAEFVESDTKLTLRMMLQGSQTASVSYTADQYSISTE